VIQVSPSKTNHSSNNIHFVCLNWNCCWLIDLLYRLWLTQNFFSVLWLFDDWKWRIGLW
jgi:hypothetical protein